MTGIFSLSYRKSATPVLEVYRHNLEAMVLGEGDILTVPELLEGWELAVSELWPPVFDAE